MLDKVGLRFAQRSVSNAARSFLHAIKSKSLFTSKQVVHRRSQYEANRGTRLGKILSNTVDFYFFFIRLIILEDFIRLISYNGPCVRLGCSFFLATAL